MANIFSRAIARLFNLETYPSVEEYDQAYSKLSEAYISKFNELERAYDVIEVLLAEVNELESAEALSDELFSEMTDTIAELDTQNDELLDELDKTEQVLEYIGVIALAAAGYSVELA